jgi:hypothetical protein
MMSLGRREYIFDPSYESSQFNPYPKSYRDALHDCTQIWPCNEA